MHALDEERKPAGDVNCIENPLFFACIVSHELLLQGNRSELTEEQLQQVWTQGPETVIDRDLARSDARDLYQAGEKKRWGTDESTFLRIMAIRNFYQLRAAFEEYQQVLFVFYLHQNNLFDLDL